MKKGGGGKAKFWLRVLAPVLASIAGLLTLRLLGPDFLDQETLHRWLAPLGLWAPVVFVLLLAIRPITLLPGQIFTAVGGILFGVALGSAYAVLGSLLAAGLIWILSKRFGTRMMKRFAGDKYEAVKHTARRNDFKMAALVTLNPLVPTDMMIAVAAASGCRFWPTAAGVLVGTLPGTILTAQFGNALGEGKTIMTAVAATGMLVSMVLGVLLGRKMVSDFGAAKKHLSEHEPAAPRRKLAAST